MIKRQQKNSIEIKSEINYQFYYLIGYFIVYSMKEVIFLIFQVTQSNHKFIRSIYSIFFKIYLSFEIILPESNEHTCSFHVIFVLLVQQLNHVEFDIIIQIQP